MTIAEILKAKGLDDATISEIQEEMKTNKIFTASEENLDIRYGKLKTEHDSKLSELTEANNLIAELKKSNKGNEGLQQQIADYEGQGAKLQAELEQTKLDAAIKVELLSAKALDEDLTRDVYIVATDFSWTYVRTHERDKWSGCGPFFCAIESDI